MPKLTEVRASEPADQNSIREIWHSAFAKGALAGDEAREVDQMVDRLSIESSGFFVAANDLGVAGILDNNTRSWSFKTSWIPASTYSIALTGKTGGPQFAYDK